MQRDAIHVAAFKRQISDLGSTGVVLNVRGIADVSISFSEAEGCSIA